MLHLKLLFLPKNGHGNNIYRELGSNRVMINTVFDNNSSDNSLDYIIGNNFSRVGIIYNPTVTSTVNNTGVALGAIKVKSATADPLSDTTYTVNTEITQTVSAGTTASAYVASYDANNGIIRYYQPVGLARSETNYELNAFQFTTVGGQSAITINGQTSENALIIDNFDGNSVVDSNTWCNHSIWS